MGDDMKSAGIGKKIGSVVLLLVGLVALYGVLLSVVASVLQPGWPDGTFWLLSLVTAGIGAGIVRGGVVLWNRWRSPAAVILLLLGCFTVPKVLGVRSSAGRAVGVEAEWLTRTASAFSAVGAVLILAGVALYFVGRRQDRTTAIGG